MTAHLSAQELDYAYPGQVQALRQLSLNVARGRRLAILGPNGAGKSTLLLHLNGSLRPDRGAVQLAGVPGRYDRAGLNDWRNRVALVLQDPDDQIFAATVAEDVSFGPMNQGLPESEVRTRVQGALTALGIEDLADRAPHMLSGGQKKRVAIAGAVAMAPEILLLDEPTAGLDRAGGDQVITLLRALGRTGMTLVFSTHDIELAAALADEVALFRGGTVLAQGPAEALLADAAILARAGLRPPLLIELWQGAIARGLCRADTPMPRSAAELLARLAPAGWAATPAPCQGDRDD